MKLLRRAMRIIRSFRRVTILVPLSGPDLSSSGRLSLLGKKHLVSVKSPGLQSDTDGSAISSGWASWQN